MGRDLDPGNPMYQPGGEPQTAEHESAGHSPAMAAAFGGDTMPQMLVASPATADSAVDFDLDLDFSVGDEPVMATQAVAPPTPAYTPEPAVALQAAAADPIFDGLDMDFSADATAVMTPSLAASAPVPAPTATDNSLSFNVDPLPSFSQPAPVAAAPLDSGMLEFDLGSLSLDLDGPVTESPTLSKAVPASATAPAPVEGPLETKFALAEEFSALGDNDGARSLASEVVAQAQGALKTKAQAFLNALS